MLFGECPSLIVVSLNEDKLYDLVLLSKKYNVQTQTIGKVTNDGIFTINDSISIKKDKLSNAYNNSLEKSVS